jgi:hypothetical protein
MRIINIILFIPLILGLQSCGYSEEFNEINHNNEFIISFPDYMENCDDFSADIGYKNSYRNTYALVKVYEKEGKSLAQFHESVLSTLKSYELLKDPLVTDSVSRQGVNYKAIDIELYGVMENENIYYWHSAFESEEKFFEVVCWTRSMDRKQRYGADLEKIITGFKPLI